MFFRAPVPYPQVRWLDPPGTHPCPICETEVGQEPGLVVEIFHTNHRREHATRLGAVAPLGTRDEDRDVDRLERCVERCLNA